MNGPSVTTSPRIEVAVEVGCRARPSMILPPVSATCSENLLCASITCWSTSGVAVAYALSSSQMRIMYSAMVVIILPFRQGLRHLPRRSAGPGIDKPPPFGLAAVSGGPTPESVPLPGRAGGGLFRVPAQLLHGGRGVVGPVDRRARNEHVGPCLRAPLDGFLFHPAIHLETHRRAVPLHQCPCPPQLGQHDVEEGLATEARLDGHQQQHVEFGQQVFVGLHRSGGGDRKGGAGPRGADYPQGA